MQTKATMPNATERLATAPVGPLLLQLAIPSIVAQVVNILYNIVDRIYIGRMADGALAMSAVSVALPVVTFISAVTSLLGAGGAPLASIRMGEQKKTEADKIMSASFSALLVAGVLLTGLILANSTKLLLLFGADASNLQYAKDYTNIYALGTVSVLIAFGMNPYINTQGYQFYGMITVLLGAVLNIILDPILIFTLHMGVKGAALATIFSQSVSAVWALLFLFGKKSILRVRRSFLLPEGRIIGGILALGVAPFIMTATESMLQIAFNNQMSRYGGTEAVGAMSILLSIYHMATFPIIGVAQGAQPILSYNFGAGNRQRVKDAFRILYITGFLISSIGIAFILIFSRFFASVFTTDEALIQVTAWGLRCYLLGGFFFGTQFAVQQSFVALGQAKQSLFVALFRKIILLIPLIYLLPNLIGDTSFAARMAAPAAELLAEPGRAFAVLFAESLSDILSVATANILFFTFFTRYLRGDTK